MSCMRIFRLSKKGCYNLINAQNDQYLLEVVDNCIETTKCFRMSSFRLKSTSDDSLLVPWLLNIGNLGTYVV